MKKLFALVALVGMGAFIAGCAEETKPPAKPAGGGAAATPGPKAGGATDKPADKGDADKGDKGDMPPDGDAKPDGDEKPDGDAKPEEGDAKPDSEETPKDE